MPFIIDIDKIQQTENAYKGPWGTQCVALVQMAQSAANSSNPPNTSMWRQGIQVHGAALTAIAKGTVIATFIHGIYPPGDPRHAAVYLSHDDKGIQVIDQWVGKPAPSNSRPLNFRSLPEKRALGLQDVDNGELYYVVELTAAPVQGSTGVDGQTLAN
jgi:hypothetical protein